MDSHDHNWEHTIIGICRIFYSSINNITIQSSYNQNNHRYYQQQLCPNLLIKVDTLME